MNHDAAHMGENYTDRPGRVIPADDHKGERISREPKPSQDDDRMTTATSPRATKSAPQDNTRAGMQERLRNKGKTLAEYKEAAKRLQGAEQLVAEFERPVGYADRFEREASAISRELFELNNGIQNRLADQCCDPELKTAYRDAKAAQSAERSRQAAAATGLEAAEVRLDSVRSRMVESLGEPGRLTDNGAELPWSRGVVAGVVAMVTGAAAGVPQWATTDDGARVEFNPRTVRRDDSEGHRRQWEGAVRDRRHAAADLATAVERVKAAESAFEAARAAKIWSVQ